MHLLLWFLEQKFFHCGFAKKCLGMIFSILLFCRHASKIVKNVVMHLYLVIFSYMLMNVIWKNYIHSYILIENSWYIVVPSVKSWAYIVCRTFKIFEKAMYKMSFHKIQIVFVVMNSWFHRLYITNILLPFFKKCERKDINNFAYTPRLTGIVTNSIRNTVRIELNSV